MSGSAFQWVKEQSVDYLRVIAAVIAGTTALLVLLIPAESCLLGGVVSPGEQPRCFSISFVRAVTNDLAFGVDFRWPLRVGILAVGAIATLLVLRAADREAVSGRD